MEPPRIGNNFSPSFLCPISAFSAFSARDSLTPRRAEDVKSGLLLRRPLSSDSQLQRLLRGIFPGQQCASARMTAHVHGPPRFRKDDGACMAHLASARMTAHVYGPPRFRKDDGACV